MERHPLLSPESTVKRCSRCGQDRDISGFKYKATARLYSYCQSCRKEMRSEAYRKNEEKERASNRVWRKAHPDKMREYSRKNRALHGHRHRTLDRVSKLRRVYGISEHDFDALREAQRDRCAICNDVFEKRPRVDHCHKTNKVRGLLCGRCNRGIGMFGDSPVKCREAANYLEKAGM